MARRRGGSCHEEQAKNSGNYGTLAVHGRFTCRKTGKTTGREVRAENGDWRVDPAVTVYEWRRLWFVFSRPGRAHACQRRAPPCAPQRSPRCAILCRLDKLCGQDSRLCGPEPRLSGAHNRYERKPFATRCALQSLFKSCGRSRAKKFLRSLRGAVDTRDVAVRAPACIRATVSLNVNASARTKSSHGLA